MKKTLRNKVLQVSEEYEKRKMTTDLVDHYILFPVAFSALGRKNEFYIHALSLCWNDKNIAKDSRCQQMIRGLNLKQPIDIDGLSKSTDGWFTSCRHIDLEKIGKVAGYFIRRFSRTVGKALDEKFDPQFPPINDEKFIEFISALKKEETVVPAIIKLRISVQSAFDTSKFICLEEKIVKDLANRIEVNVTHRCKILKVASEFHDWAWKLLDTLNHEEIQKLLLFGVKPVASSLQEIGSHISTSVVSSPLERDCGMEQKKTLTSTRSSSRKRRSNKLYSEELFELN